MRKILLSVGLATLVALTNVPAVSAGTGVGTGTHSIAGHPLQPDCVSDARWVLSAEAGVGGVIVGDSICPFQPDYYLADDCYLIAGGSECTYPTGGGSSRLTIYDDGGFDYNYDWPNGAIETVVGSLLI